MKKPIIVLLHLGYWMMYMFLLVMLIAALNQGRLPLKFIMFRNPASIAAFVPAIIGFYSFYFILFEKFLAKKKMFFFFLSILLICLVSPVITELILYSTFIADTSYNTIFFAGLAVSFLTLINGVLGLVMKGFITWYDDIKVKMELTKKNYEMELALVKNQINPHFLFNTINNIDVLIQKDPAKASDYLNKLSDIMRFMLYETKADKIALSTELSYLEKYIELQKIRSSNPSYVNYSIEGSSNDLMIEPMLFIPFIENAFKHTENKNLENAINIKITINKEMIIFECENKFTINSQNKSEHNGLGNGLIEKRLLLLYPNKHQLNITTHNNIYKVKLTLNNVH